MSWIPSSKVKFVQGTSALRDVSQMTSAGAKLNSNCKLCDMWEWQKSWMLNLIKQDLEIKKILTPKFNCWNGKHRSHSLGDQTHRSKHGLGFTGNRKIMLWLFDCVVEVWKWRSVQRLFSRRTFYYDVLETAMDLTEDHNSIHDVLRYNKISIIFFEFVQKDFYLRCHINSLATFHSLSFEINVRLFPTLMHDNRGDVAYSKHRTELQMSISRHGTTTITNCKLGWLSQARI